jgi:phage host-nuclease inhibitor protein Gam
MAKSRTKKLVQTGITGEQMEQAFSDYSISDAKIQVITSRMDVEITRIREKYQDDLQKWGEMREKNFDILQSFAMERREELFTKRKSMETVHGVFGFRTGTPKLKTLKGYTWGAVTNLLKEFLPGYVRTTEEPAKDKLLSDREDPEINKLFPRIGVFVDQDETFFVEPKKEEVIGTSL